ncbi:unnamed protein product [Paramecium octaurelia]|uniref:Uncharacterized protein n=1 Tax=Paramecium octaurelia TaxID=43137 RepID=A0A8S1TYP3_PAROT|nr:unnamed protein product [Paramecium octaurelia]
MSLNNRMGVVLSQEGYSTPQDRMYISQLLRNLPFLLKYYRSLLILMKISLGIRVAGQSQNSTGSKFCYIRIAGEYYEQKNFPYIKKLFKMDNYHKMSQFIYSWNTKTNKQIALESILLKQQFNICQKERRQYC